MTLAAHPLLGHAWDHPVRHPGCISLVLLVVGVGVVIVVIPSSCPRATGNKMGITLKKN